MIRFIKDYLIVFLFYIFRVFPIQNNKVIICMFQGKGFGSEGKPIADILLKSNRYDIVWVCKNIGEVLPEGIRPVKFNSIRSVYEYCTAKYWIDNRRKNNYFRKRKKQIYFQTWHGNVCIKKVEADAITTLPSSYIKSAINDSSMVDYFISGSEWRTSNYLSAFWYKGAIIKGDLYGTNERLIKASEITKTIKREFNIPDNGRIILYAPTFRSDARLDCYDIDYERLIRNASKRFGGKWYVIVRLHPNISTLNSKLEYSEQIINGSLLPQIYDLICACDILISDYSGVIFDGFHMKKKVILYASDFARYTSEERDLYFDFMRLPSPIAKTNNELESILESFNEEKYEKDRKRFVEGIGYYNEDAATLTFEIIEKEREKVE